MITITEKAAEKIRVLLSEHEGRVLRVKVIGGGCSGLQYKLDLDRQKDNDRVFEAEGARVVTDRKSYLYLKGTEIDWRDSLVESGFQLNNPNVTKTCGCGSSFTV